MNEYEKTIKWMTDEVRDIYALQHWLMTHPEIGEVNYYGGRTATVPAPHLVVDGVTDWDQVDVAGVARLVRVMKDGGKVEKRSGEDYMTYIRKIGERAQLTMHVPRKAVCVAKVVRTEKIVHKPVAGYTETRDVIEWECAPILAEAEA